MRPFLNDLRQFRRGKRLSVLLFILGVLSDVILLTEADRPITLAQQGLYLLAAAVLLFRSPHSNAVHFFFGGLLSAYTIFYFKSGSVFVSWAFLGVLCGLLIANETQAFRKRGPVVRFALFALCAASYFGYLVPVLMRSLHPVAFFIAILIAALVQVVLATAMIRQDPARRGLVRREVLLPGAVVLSVFGGLYLAGAIPPVPLSLKYVGIFHGLEKREGQYVLFRERPS